MPFLYLPDALSLLLLLIVLTLLRQAAAEHLRQDLRRILEELSKYWRGEGLSLEDPVYASFRSLLVYDISLAERISPASHFFVFRLWRKQPSCVKKALEGSLNEAGVSVGEIGEKNVRARIRRFELETNLSLGFYYLLGSISGWMLTLWLAWRVLIRSFRSGRRNSVDDAFDLAERLVSRVGRIAQAITLMQEPVRPGRSPQQENP
jgi:hypothetical protein